MVTATLYKTAARTYKGSPMCKWLSKSEDCARSKGGSHDVLSLLDIFYRHYLLVYVISQRRVSDPSMGLIEPVDVLTCYLRLEVFPITGQRPEDYGMAIWIWFIGPLIRFSPRDRRYFSDNATIGEVYIIHTPTHTHKYIYVLVDLLVKLRTRFSFAAVPVSEPFSFWLISCQFILLYSVEPDRVI